MVEARLPAPPPPSPSDPGDFLRLAPCPQCGGRGRTLVETPSAVEGRCLGCGAALSAPLDIAVQDRQVLVGRGGQALVGRGGQELVKP